MKESRLKQFSGEKLYMKLYTDVLVYFLYDPALAAFTSSGATDNILCLEIQWVPTLHETGGKGRAISVSLYFVDDCKL